MAKWKIYNEDAVEWARNYQKAKFHALLCDAPYHLTTITKRFGKNGSAPAKYGQDGVFQRASKGFMSQTWDGGDLAFRPETWEAFGQVLHPGAFGMAFSASRNWHRMAVAIEDAGFILHPTIFLWAYGQGFPKATNIDKQIDKQNGNERRTGKLRKDGRGADPIKLSLRSHGDTGIGHADGSHQQYYESLPSDESSIWQGHRYGLQALKPAVEPIICFQKPYEGRPLDNIVQTGAGALNIDGARIPTSGENVIINRFNNGMKPWGNAKGESFDTESTQQGRWPANLILDGSGERLDAQTGILHGHGSNKHSTGAIKGMFAQGKEKRELIQTGGDSGGASRFFYNVSQRLDESDPVYYCGKVSPKERNAGLDDMDEVDYVVSDGGRKALENGRGEYLQDSIGINRVHKVKNPHPTLKPIDLCRYLATLLLPPVEYAPRRIFIPFSGVASEMCGAGLAGWEHIVGVEFDKENGYVDIAEKRLQHWLKENK